MAIPTILKGETAKPIRLALADGYDYAGCSLHVDFCRTRSTFVELNAGGSLELRFTAEQTAGFPLGTSKAMLSLENAAGKIRFMPWAKIKVTDSPADLYDAQITIDPATLNVDDLTRSDNPDVVKSRVNAILAFLRGLKVLALALIPLGILADVTPKYAISDYIPGDMPIMTNVEEFVEAKMAEAGKVKSVNGRTGAVVLSAPDVGALAADGTAFRASSVGSAERWTDATGCVWQATFDVARDWWTIEPAESAGGMSVFWDGDSWVLRYEGYNNDTGHGADVYSFGFRLGIQYTATRHPGGAATLVDRVALQSQIPGDYAIVSNRAVNAVQRDDFDTEMYAKRDMGDIDVDGWMLTGPDGRREVLWYSVGNGGDVQSWYSSDISRYIVHFGVGTTSMWTLSVDTEQRTVSGPANVTELSFDYGGTKVYRAVRINSRFVFESDLAAATNALAAKIVAPDVIATNLVKTVISNSLYNLTYDAALGVTWQKTAEGGAFYERCYTNINMIGVRP
ncbi:MAG: hypothetical protein IJ173_05095 [Kiritimatiellae bacterium]|nr:hypothetical protein [Kiritimatiellia bacterium]